MTAKPNEIKNEQCHSGARNVYKTKLTGDSHCRGVRMVVNSTFTAGGLSAPIFVCVYGLSYDEMPKDGMICLEIPGLYSGSHQNIYSNGVGFLVFVRGNNSRSDTQVNTVDDTIDLEGVNQEYVLHDDEVRYSKESIVAQMYRSKV